MLIVSQYDVEDTRRAQRQATPEGVQRFKEAAYGLSVHWGLYSLSESGTEWIYFNDRIPWAAYRQRLNQFNPTEFNAEAWADLMVEAGQKFMLLTAKHHDGFCLWDTQLTNFKVTNTPFGRDVIAELAPALRARAWPPFLLLAAGLDLSRLSQQLVCLHGLLS